MNEGDTAKSRREVAFRDQFDFDSVGTLNFAIGLNQVFGVEVPETDYRQLASLSRAVAYVARRLREGAPAASGE